MNHLIYRISQALDIPFHSAGVAQSQRGKNYITWQIISDIPARMIDHRRDISKVRIQFDIYTVDEKSVFEISSQLEKELLGKGLTLLRSGPFFNADTKMYRRTIDVSFLRGSKHESI